MPFRFSPEYMQLEPANPHRFCVAPMLDWTTPECRALHRLFSRHAFLYSEMVTSGALIFGDVPRHLHHAADAPCALQLGGGEPEALARACEIALPYGYQEINLNVGCPSDRVQHNRIGACLMDDAPLVAECLAAMQAAADAVPVTVKHRLAIDEQDERCIFNFVETLAARSPCRLFIIHARKAWLQGLSPKDNRDVPPLNYPLVYEVKRRFPELTIIINGGITTLAECRAHLQAVDGVMLGRAAYQNPELLLAVDELYGAPARTLAEVLPAIRSLLVEALGRGEMLAHYTRHLLGLFPGVRGAKQYRRILSEEARATEAGIAVFDRALAAVGMAG